MAVYANRGRGLEQILEYSLLYYNVQGIAMIEKIPTPVRILRRRKSGEVVGYLEKKSTVDYTGLYQGVRLAFDAKSTKIETRFPLKNIADHQYQYLARNEEHGGLSFLIVEFRAHQKLYYLPFALVREYREKSERKSIPYAAFKEEIPQGRTLVDFLKIVDQELGGDGNGEGC